MKWNLFNYLRWEIRLKNGCIKMDKKLENLYNLDFNNIQIKRSN